jgi:2,3-bisphosphoglycerate-dependent phosphoglycerate mutase
MQFYFIRHAQSANNLLYDTTGASTGRSSDPELTSVGLQQLLYLARFLKTDNADLAVRPFNTSPVNGFGITHLYTSLMARAVATGSYVARELGLPLVAWEDIHETGGIYLDDAAALTRIGQPGKSRAEFQSRFPELVLPPTMRPDGWWNRPFEEREQRPARAERFLNELLLRYGGKNDRVAIISHGGFYNYVLRAIFKIGRDDCWFGLNNVAITRIDFHAEGVDLVYMNRVEFLPHELVT